MVFFGLFSLPHKRDPCFSFVAADNSSKPLRNGGNGGEHVCVERDAHQYRGFGASLVSEVSCRIILLTMKDF